MAASRGTSETLLNTIEVAALLRVHPKHVYRLLRRGLPARRLGGEWRFVEKDVLAWMETRSSSPATASPDASLVRAERGDLVAANGDVIVERLIESSNARGAPLVGFVRSDRTRALELLERGEVIAAGCHGALPPTRVGGVRLARVHLAEREVGLAYAKGPAPKLENLQRVTLASRPATAGIVMHLNHALAAARIDARRALRGSRAFESHEEVVCAVLRGEAEVGLTTHAWAHRVGLRFTTIATESYGLIVRGVDLGDPVIVRLCEVAQSPAFHKALANVAGYDLRGAGEIRYDPEITAASEP